MDWPIGHPEGLHLEFKAAEALERPAVLARAVVGFLNSEGGELWVGVREHDGVAVEAEAIPDPGAAIARLQDALVDLVEPAPRIGQDLAIEQVPFPGVPNRCLLRVRVNKGRGGPHALLQQGGRHYLTRTGSRQRPMTRQEIAEAFRQGTSDQDGTRDSERRVAERLDEGLEHPGLLVLVDPAPRQTNELPADAIEPLLRYPGRSGNRQHGWSFTSSREEVRRFNEGGGRSGWRMGAASAYQWIELLDDGLIRFSARLERLHWKGPDRSLWPYALLEFPASISRLARTLFLEQGPPQSVVLGLGLYGVKGWKLAPHSPASIGFLLGEARTFEQADDFVANPIEIRWSEFEEAPDRSAVRLVRQVYEAFGYDERHLPGEYDARSGRLTFPP